MDKAIIRERLLTLEAHELQDTREAYASYVASAHVDASQAFDVQDASQAVQARNLSEAFDSPLHDQQHKIDLLERIDFGPKTTVAPGAVVKLDGRYFVIGVATGPFACEGRTLMGLSTEAPIYEELADRREGERFAFRGREHLVQEVM
jgi:hypothetical protein